MPVKRSDVAGKWSMWCADCGAKNHKNATKCERCGYGDDNTLFGVSRKQNVGNPEYTSDGEAGVYVRDNATTGSYREEDDDLRTDGGQQTLAVPVYAHVAGDGMAHCSFGARMPTVDDLEPPAETSLSTLEWIEGQFFQTEWADDVIERLVPEPRREPLGVDKCEVGTLTVDPPSGRILDVSFEEPEHVPGPDLATDGGHAPGTAAASDQPPTRGRTWLCAGCETPFGSRADVTTARGDKYCSLVCYLDDVGMLGPEVHRCDLCEQVFDTLADLADHDCDPPGDMLGGEGGGRGVE